MFCNLTYNLSCRTSCEHFGKVYKLLLLFGMFSVYFLLHLVYHAVQVYHLQIDISVWIIYSLLKMGFWNHLLMYYYLYSPSALSIFAYRSRYSDIGSNIFLIVSFWCNGSLYLYNDVPHKFYVIYCKYSNFCFLLIIICMELFSLSSHPHSVSNLGVL